MKSTHRKISRSHVASPFERWMELCAAPVVADLNEIDLPMLYSSSSFVHGQLFGITVLAMIDALIFCGGGLAVWCILKIIALAMRKTQRPKYYPAEKMRRQALAAERRRVRRRYTVNVAPTREELLAQFARVKRNPKEMIRFGSMLCDLEAYVDNSLRRNGSGVIIGRNPGIRGWFAENCVELGAHYKTVMRYKAMAEQFRQVVGLRDPLPAALAIDDAEDDVKNENMVRNNNVKAEWAENGARENTVRKVSLEERVIVGRARKRAAEFFAKCGSSMRGAYVELEQRLAPDKVPHETVVEERLRQGLPPEPGVRERFVSAVLA